jgi:UDP-N-acetylglucosamine enolpyruvyl transferase
VLCAPLLTSEKVTISNIPDIVDVNKLIALLQTMGVKVEKVEKGTYIFQAKEIDLAYLETEDFKKCARENINAECVPHRIDFFRCKRFMVDRSKDFRKDPRHGI